MKTSTISEGTVHKMPGDLRAALAAGPEVTALWGSLTPLARNEYICWVENAKHMETRARRVRRTVEELLDGMRRPCCWIGCIHRPDKPISPSVKGILEKRNNI